MLRVPLDPTVRAAVSLLLCAVLSACSTEEPGQPEGAPPSNPEIVDTSAGEPIGTVTIEEPVYSGDVMGTSVTVRLSVTGFPVVPAGDMTPRTGHHHLFLDADLTAPDEPIPTIPGQIVHLGTGDSTYTFEDLSIGQHRLIAVVADGAHFPLQPWVVDTVVFNVH